MRCLVHDGPAELSVEALTRQLEGAPGLVVLQSALADAGQGRYSLVAAYPFLEFRCQGSRGEWRTPDRRVPVFGDPWRIVDAQLARCQLLDEPDMPFPLGGVFGFWGYDLKHFVEPRLPRRAVDDLELPDAWLGFHDSLVVFDHRESRVLVVSTGMQADGSRSPRRARAAMDRWRRVLDAALRQVANAAGSAPSLTGKDGGAPPGLASSMSRETFLQGVVTAQDYIRRGHIYQVNLAQRLRAAEPARPLEFFEELTTASPASFAAFLDAGDFAIASSSPERFLRLSGREIETRPIKGTRPRGRDADHDARLSYELQTSAKEMAELVMITDLLRNDLGRVCAYGSVRVPELARLERYAQVQHLVSTVRGRLRDGVTHSEALARCFPGGSITGAPKIRAMELIDELEPVARGPYTGAIGYLGFNQESQLSIAIRTAVLKERTAWFHVGAGIVADSDPVLEYQETLAKAGGFVETLRRLGSASRGEARIGRTDPGLKPPVGGSGSSRASDV